MNRQIQLRLLAFFVTFVSTLSLGQKADAQQVAWQTDFHRAARYAKQLDKPMLIEVGATWCGYCKKMQRETFQNAHIANHINACFVPLAIDADADKQLVKAMGVRSLPTTVFVTPDMKIVEKLAGYKSPREFDTHLERICKQH